MFDMSDLTLPQDMRGRGAMENRTQDEKHECNPFAIEIGHNKITFGGQYWPKFSHKWWKVQICSKLFEVKLYTYILCTLHSAVNSTKQCSFLNQNATHNFDSTKACCKPELPSSRRRTRDNRTATTNGRKCELHTRRAQRLGRSLATKKVRELGLGGDRVGE